MSNLKIAVGPVADTSRRREGGSLPRFFLVLGWVLNLFTVADPIFSRYLASRFNEKVYRISAKVHPYVRFCAAGVAMLVACYLYLENVFGLQFGRNFGMLCLLSVPALLIICGGGSIPNKLVPTIQHSLHPARTVAVHMGAAIPAWKDLPQILDDAIDGIAKIQYRRISLRSPIFGTEEALTVWVSWLERRLRRINPNATVTVLDREPMSWYVSGRYLVRYGDRHVSVVDGRLQAARILIENF